MKRKTMITIPTTAAMTPPPIPPPEGPEEYPEERNLRRARAAMNCIGAMITAAQRCEYLVNGNGACDLCRGTGRWILVPLNRPS